MRSGEPWVYGSILLLTIASSILLNADNRLIEGATAIAITGTAAVFAFVNRGIRLGVWAIIGVLTLLGGITALISRNSALAVCTATNASDELVVIGTELTDAGRRYRETHPNESNSMMLESLGAVDPAVLWTDASIARCRRMLAISSALWAPLFGVAAISAATMAIRRNAGDSIDPPLKHQVFISYNHSDTPEAQKLKRFLTEHGVEVAIDSDRMRAGERIETFIDRCIRESRFVLSVVSNRSLLSSWVAMETIESFNRNKTARGRLFIACYLDDGYFRPEYRLECTKQIDARLAQLEQLFPEYAEKKLDTVDLNEEKSRLFALRNNLGLILATLKQTLCLDMREAEFEKSGKKLLAAIEEAGRREKA